jgi:TolB-like protein
VTGAAQRAASFELLPARDVALSQRGVPGSPICVTSDGERVVTDVEQIRLGRMTLQPRRQLLADGKRVPVGRRGLEILSVLAEAGGNLVTKDELMTAVWPSAIVEENAMQAQITALRKALGAEAALLKTVRGIGYQLELPASEARPPSADAGTMPSLVVLPFENIGDDESQEYFADGICEDIITDLSKVSGLSVIARNTAFTLKGQSVDIAEVARRFAVSHVLKGSVRKAGERVRITAQLIDAASGLHVWAERYDRDLTDIFSLQDEVAQAIAGALSVELLPGEKEAIGDRGTDNFEAYDLILRARASMGRLDLASLERSLELTTRAIDLDPGSMAGYRHLAAAIDYLEFLAPERKTECDRRRKRLIERAGSVAPNDPLFLLMRCRDHVQKRELVIAEEINREVAQGTNLGMFWGSPEFFGFYVGRFEPVLEMARRRVERDPLDRMSSMMLHDLLDICGRLDEADEEARRNRDLPGDRCHFEFSTLHRAKGRATPDELSALFRNLLDSGDFVSTVPLTRQIEPVLHHPGAARKLIRAALSDPDCQDPFRQLWIARFAAFYDDTDTAVDVLRRVFMDSATMIDLRCMMWQQPFVQARRDPRFKDVLEALGLPAYWRATGRWGDFVRPLDNGDFEVIK